MNLDSKKLGKKAIIKVTDRFFTSDEVNRIALIAPMAKLNIIRDYEVVEKREVEVPEVAENILKCINPKCITNHEKIGTKFRRVSFDPLEMQCCYCEKYIDQDHFELTNN
jgi:aspartate carbamoyltransferase regulatory subunit